MPALLDRSAPLPAGLQEPVERAAKLHRLVQKKVITAMEANELRATGAPLPEEPQLLHAAPPTRTRVYAPRKQKDADPEQAHAGVPLREVFIRLALRQIPVCDPTWPIEDIDRWLAVLERVARKAATL